MLSYIQKHLRLMKKTTVNWKEVLPMKKDYKSVNINVPYQQELEKERKLRTEKILEAIRYLDEKNLEQNRNLLRPNEEK